MPKDDAIQVEATVIEPLPNAMFRLALENCLEKQAEAQALRGFIQGMKKTGLKDKKSGLAMDRLLECVMGKHTECIGELQLAYVKIVHADMHSTYEKLFKKS